MDVETNTEIQKQLPDCSGATEACWTTQSRIPMLLKM